MFSRTFCTALLLAALACARIVSWTAYSEDSQAAADEAAIAGVAKQISAQINASTTVSRSERESGNLSETNKAIETKNTVQSNIVLKGITLRKLPKEGKRFGAVAEIDLDKLTSAYRFKLETAQHSVSDLENRARVAIKEQRYGEAAKLLTEIPGIASKHAAILDEMATYVPIDNSLRLKTDAVAIKDSLTRLLRSIKISLKNDFNTVESLSRDSTLKLDIIVSSANGAVAGFALYAECDGKRLAETSTDLAGTAILEIDASKLPSKTGEISVLPKLPLDLQKEASPNPVQFHFSLKTRQCAYHLVCNWNEHSCATVQEKMAQLGETGDTQNFKTVTVRVKSQATRSLNNLTSYTVSLTLEADGKQCQKNGTGVGRTKEEAETKFIKQAELGNCFETLRLCP